MKVDCAEVGLNLVANDSLEERFESVWELVEISFVDVRHQ